MFAYLSYFPPPPPVVPGPPPRQYWTCSSPSVPSLSCFVSDDQNAPSLRQYIPLIDNNPSTLSPNTSNVSINSGHPIKPTSLLDHIISLFKDQFILVLILILIVTILLVLVFIIILFIYFQRHRQRQVTSNNKNKKFYYHLIPRRRKHQTTTNNNEQNLVNLTNSPLTPQVIRISTASGIHTNNNNETEEAV
jgi:hypothetical protein